MLMWANSLIKNIVIRSIIENYIIFHISIYQLYEINILSLFFCICIKLTAVSAEWSAWYGSGVKQ